VINETEAVTAGAPTAVPAAVALAAATNTRLTEGAAVAFRNVTKSFGAMQALAGFDLEIAPGELIALLGPSGCGKTTALRILAGYDHPTTGSVHVDGSDLAGLSVNHRDMGMVFQSYSLFPTMTAIDNVAFGLRLRNQAKTKRRARAGELLELVGLSGHAEKFPHQLSGGQQQRVALARALAISPRVLLLDEPLSALDAKVREQLRDEIRRIQLELGVTTLCVTHDQEEALSMADRVGVMNAGRLEQIAAPSVLYDAPATAFVATFVGTMNRLPGRVVDGQRVRVGAQELPVLGGTTDPAGTEVTVLTRPEAVQIAPSAGGSGVVLVATFRGANTRLRIAQPDGSEILADLGSHLAREISVGDHVEISLLDRPVLLDH
jgi:putative spermidine/putrescine transport system ATP-binding protein